MKENFLVKGYYWADYFVLEEGSLKKVPLVVEGNLYVNIAPSPAWGSSERFNACDLPGASSLCPSVTRARVSGAGWEEGDQGPRAAFPISSAEDRS